MPLEVNGATVIRGERSGSSLKAIALSFCGEWYEHTNKN